MTATLATIHVFPIKSCAAWSPIEARVEPRGLAGDRRWMVTDASGRFLTARKWPKLTLIRAQATPTSLRLQAPAMPDFDLFVPRDGHTLVASIWNSSVAASAAGDEADAWISACLGEPTRLVHMSDNTLRVVDSVYGRSGDIVSFADGFPLLLISQASLDALNERLVAPVPMLRFRPSVVVAGTAPHAEDTWRHIRIGAVAFDVVKPCTRCVLTTVDFERGDFDPAGEPLRTLSRYRRSALGVEFGQNLIPRGEGVIRVGDRIEIAALR